MPTLDQVEVIGTHLLLCGDTKMGKGDYVAQAVLDGHHCLYIDSDHGGTTLKDRLKNNAAAQKRVIYIPTQNPYPFVYAFFTSGGVFRWNLTQDVLFSAGKAQPTDMVVEIYTNRIPVGILGVVDSWSTVALDGMDKSADKQNVDLDDMGEAQRKVYGGANWGLIKICEKIQKTVNHWIVHAHVLRYEVKEKKPGTVRESSKEGDMVIKETLTVPVSSSGNNGIAISKFFNQIGWLGIDRAGGHVLSFEKKHDRIGGGSAGVDGKGDPRKDFSFTKLFAQPIPYTPEEIASWYREFPASEYVPPAALSVQKKATPAAAPVVAKTEPAAVDKLAESDRTTAQSVTAKSLSSLFGPKK
jgi:hypothetical protein